MKRTINFTFEWDHLDEHYHLYHDGRFLISLNSFSSVIELIKCFIDHANWESFVDGVPARQWLDQQYDNIGESPVRHEFWS